MIFCIRQRYSGYLYTGVWKPFLKKVLEAWAIFTLYFSCVDLIEFLYRYMIWRNQDVSSRSQKVSSFSLSLGIQYLKDPRTLSGVNQDSSSDNYALVT